MDLAHATLAQLDHLSALEIQFKGLDQQFSINTPSTLLFIASSIATAS
jgi:hypothetical protein